MFAIEHVEHTIGLLWQMPSYCKLGNFEMQNIFKTLCRGERGDVIKPHLCKSASDVLLDLEWYSFVQRCK